MYTGQKPYLSHRHPRKVPFMLFADQEGNIIENTHFEVVGRTASNNVRLQAEDFIEMPEGSELFFLPNRRPIGYNYKSNNIEVYDKGYAVSVFVSPAHTQTYLAAYTTENDAPVLPLYAYTAVGWLDDKFYVAAVRIDPDIRQDVPQFNIHAVKKGVKMLKKKYPDNRLIDHIANNCALDYHCRAAQNYFLNRWECPIPASPVCNANCIGCISLQPEEHEVDSAHFRLKFRPSVSEISSVAIDHLETAPTPIVSYGQGCEGEPLLVGKTLVEATKAIREKTDKGIININTNGSKPDVVDEMCKAGLQSIRVSMNSAQEEWYKPYYLPKNYSFNDIKSSIKVVRKHGGWASINYFVFPGLTDSEEEYQALRNFIIETDLSMIQWRNFNVDPDWYFEKTGIKNVGKAMGMKVLMEKIHEEFPWIAYGYFNPTEEKQIEFKTLRESLQKA